MEPSRPQTDYAATNKTNIQVIVQDMRLDSRQSDEPFQSTMAFPVSNDQEG
ncbi:hypothetical protein JQS30_06075 [Natronoglycomyces albus]|uniref:Uncharacterized protein n=1 Tax=Natronoglycomyces albus TaxID=2811108 RepID=A0A895XMV4_9ACTN|nr:hypothetical protein JQS30_06075 [Natronoglycomyces albus]